VIGLRSVTRAEAAEPRRRPDRGRYIPSLPTLPPAALLPRGLRAARPAEADAAPFPPAGSATHLFYLARAGVFHAIRHLLLRRPGLVLMPAYHHGVEIEAVEQTGARIELYRVDENMRVDFDGVTRRLRRGDVSVLYLTHFAGFPEPATAELAAIAAARGVALFEDCAHALFSRDAGGRPLGSLGAASVFCLYKTLPVPHGGVLHAPGIPVPASPPAPPLLSTLHHVAGLALGHIERRAGTVGAALRRSLRAAAHATVDTVVETVKTGTQHIAPGDLERGASRLVAHLLGAFDAREVVARRRANFIWLARALAGRVEVLGDPLPAGCSPLFVPLRIANGRKVEAVRALKARGIDAIDFWNEPGRPSGYPEIEALRRDIMEIPCHQSLDDEDLELIRQATVAALSSRG
jgi:perosamine synthetase